MKKNKKEINKKKDFSINLKRAEMSSKMMVTIILLIIGFGIILVVFTVFIDWGGMTDREVCHQSILLRGTLPGLGVREIVPLNCKTQKICIRGSKFLQRGGCEDSFSVDIDDVKYIDVKTIDDVHKVIADEIVGCWAMTGEGKISLFSLGFGQIYGVKKVYSSCIICSRISFDVKTLSERNINLGDINVYDYMSKNRMPNQDVSYLSFLTKEKALIDFTELPKRINIKEDDYLEGGDPPGNMINENPADLLESFADDEEIAVLFMQIAAPGTSDVILTSLGMAGGAAVIMPTAFYGIAAKALKKVCLSSGWGVAACVAVVAAATATVWIGGSINRGIASTYCGDLMVDGNPGRGCSIVRTVKYTPSDISDYCGVIESIS